MPLDPDAFQNMFSQLASLLGASSGDTSNTSEASEAAPTTDSGRGPDTRLAGISGHTGFLELKSGRTGPDNIPDFPENPFLSGFLGVLGVF